MIRARNDMNVYASNLDENSTVLIQNIFALLNIDKHVTYHTDYDSLESGNTTLSSTNVVVDTIDINFTSPTRRFKRYVLEVSVYTPRKLNSISIIGILNKYMPNSFKSKEFKVSCIKFKPFKPNGTTSNGSFKIHSTQLIMNIEEM